MPKAPALLPCPFCGDEPTQDGDYVYHEPHPTCAMSDDYNLVAAWNTRTLPAASDTVVSAHTALADEASSADGKVS